ncbi:MAG: pyruvate, water dikinase [Deltaproteobacteria bacterium]|nr:pyruvate, water dikinase [Deltaproteobacteria bacterium]
MFAFIKNIREKLSKKIEIDDIEAERLRNNFRGRYHHFKLLLSANNKALEIMSEIEAALKGEKPFGMSYVRSRCTRVSTSVWQIIKNINELNPGKYNELYDRFLSIQKRINPYLASGQETYEGLLTIPLEDVNRELTDQVGGKMANLGEIGSRTGHRISNGFAITSTAYRLFMKHNDIQTEINRLLQTIQDDNPDKIYNVSSAIQKLILKSPLPEELKNEISDQYKRLEEKDGENIKVAMRSSALGEDMPGASFAGQYRSELNIARENIYDSYRNILASKYSPAAMTYRLNRGMRDESIAMCVGCLSMVDAVSGGVAYSTDPINHRIDDIVISSVWGLPKPVVDGSSPTDLFRVSRGNPMTVQERSIAQKDEKFVCYADEGVCRMDITGDMNGLPSLSDEQAVEIAKAALDLERFYGGPQDIEWAIKPDGTIVILQCRPLQRIINEDAPEHGNSRETGAENLITRGGFTASPGAASGPVYILKKDVDLLRFPDGAVLVTIQALPRWAVLLNRASAVITEHGSITGHLANVAREFDVPAIFGMENALDILENEDVVTVDADGRTIYRGKIEELMVRKKPKKNMMEGSPVFEALNNAARNIIPLNLLDPSSRDFQPAACETFHDITRFCHEKSVEEMFSFGKDHHFPERSSKQLYYKVPMQWWILNLDDGFKHEVTGRYVKLEDIASIPMLALWEGIIAIPWDGPPPVDGRGLMSVMFRATANRDLETGASSKYAERNYFLISKNYCSLSSRLGFHFSTIEAMVSERKSENYISFQFKGGAADEARRTGRIFFIRSILEEYGFSVSVREDNLIARIEGFDDKFMINRLKILGYLTIHTRQLDMIMGNEGTVNYYRSKLHADIKRILDMTDNIE